MATESPYRSEIARKREHFDRLASTWSSQITKESLVCLKDIVVRINIKPGSQVLDVGSGTGILVPFLIEAVKESGMIVEMDISAKMLRVSQGKNFKGNIHYIQADVAAMPLGDEFFDLVICHNAFPHFNDKLKALKEMARVIKGGGKLVICHTMSREAVNSLHRSIGGVVANDFLPDETELCWLLSQAGLEKAKLENSAKRYLVVAYKKSSSGGGNDVSINLYSQSIAENNRLFADVARFEIDLEKKILRVYSLLGEIKEYADVKRVDWREENDSMVIQ